MLAILVILPLIIAAFVAPLLDERADLIRSIALISSLISLILVILLGTYPYGTQSITWFSIGKFSIHLTFQTYPLGMLFLYLIAIITPLIIFYSIGFMEKPSEQARYYFELLIFASAIMLFAIAGNFIVMFIGWELLGITSYLLIGFWHYKDAPPDAARKAITTVFIGDLLMFSAMIMIWTSYNTFSFSYLLSAPQSNALYIAMILIMFAAFTKAAQFPFHEWLPDAMEGPTPVSAFLHSSTMVKAGVFIVAILLPIYINLKLGYLLIIFGVITAFIGVLNALAEAHIKRILAYSTIEDMGLMFIALGFGSLIGAMLLFVVQAFYKALLFMSAGTIMRANDENTSIFKSYGAKSYKPFFIAMLIGVISIAGIFPLSGFIGKLGVEIPVSNIYIYIMLVIVDFATSVYIFRWLIIPMREPLSDYEKGNLLMNYRIVPKSMLASQYILAALVAIAGISFFYIPGFLGSYINVPIGLLLKSSVIESVVVLAGMLLSIYIFKIRKAWSFSSSSHKFLFTAARNSIITNKFYLYLSIIFMDIAKAIDTFDYSLYNFIKLGGHSIVLFGNLVRKAENGNVNIYITAFTIGLMLLIILVLLV
ncbi:MAG: NADH-quinone oxidoreductase subunit L [Candidatus Micrarchaeia archaeon]